MLEIEVGYETGSGNILGLTIFGQLMSRKDVPLFPSSILLELCGDCKGVNGGCPEGGAPYFTQLKLSKDLFYVIVVRMDMAWALDYAGVGKSIAQSNYFRSGYADRLTDLYSWRLLRRLEDSVATTYGIGCGNCPRCTPKVCSVMRGERCLYPDERRFSVEAVGIDCHALHRELFGDSLPWWYYTPELPRYMHRYMGLFVPGDIGMSLDIAVKNDNSYVEPPHTLDYDLVDLVVPEGAYDEGVSYQGYAPEF